jgi:Holliday junction resolvase RusA-like endonuclease
VRFTVYGIPIPQGSTKAFMPKGARFPVVTSDNAKLKPWRQNVCYAARCAMESSVCPGPLSGAIHLDVAFFMPRPKRLPRRVVAHARKPDLDKLLRAICDGLTDAGVWKDDSQVESIAATKVYAGGPRDELGERGVPRAVVVVKETS